MCGILGTTNVKISQEILNQGLKEIIRRGPDNQSFISNNKVVFGQARLSIIDLDQRSNQPFEYEHKGYKVLMTYNGEIYNFLEIKSVLLVKGYKFNTSSDTEVIAAAYIEWGTLSFDYFIGMWAVAIHDSNKLIFARDRTGKKPFYYSDSQDGSISFSSSLRAVSIFSGERAISKEGLELYFALGFTPKKYTIYKNIYKLEPGKVACYELKNGIFLLQSSRDSVYKKIIKSNDKNIKAILKNAVEERIIGDVPIATLMSGGVDSTIVTALTSSFNKDLEAFFVDFEDKKLSEREWAQYLSKRNKINLTSLLMKDEDIMESFKEYYKVYEEPFADYSGIPSIAIFKKVSKKYKVVLTGDGGDELFYGYPHYLKKVLIFKLFTALRIFKGVKSLPKSLKTILADDKQYFESNYLRNHGVVTPFAANIINEEFNLSIKKKGGFTKGIIDYDRRFYNWPEKYLVKVDRASMYSSLEVRSPFMDEELLNKVSSIPTLFLFTPFLPKFYLKLKYFSLFGWKYFFARKKGFTPPIEYLRKTYYNESEFNKTKTFVAKYSKGLAMEMEKLTFDDLEFDKILFDRFFFFHEWMKSCPQ